jgi:hypothetical protein
VRRRHTTAGSSDHLGAGFSQPVSVTVTVSSWRMPSSPLASPARSLSRVCARQGLPLPRLPVGPHTLVMPRKTAKTVRLDPEDVKALKRAEADGVSPSELVRRSLRVAAARYYRGVRRPPNVTLLVSTDPLLGEESELYKDFRE